MHFDHVTEIIGAVERSSPGSISTHPTSFRLPPSGLYCLIHTILTDLDV